MAGTHHVKVRRPDRSYEFEVWAYPAHPLSRFPLIGPYFTFNLGRNPRFVVKVKYLGFNSFGAIEREFDSVSIPAPEDKALWNLDLYLEIDGESYVEGGDDLQLDLDLTTVKHKTQRYVTRRWPLSREGTAEMGVQYAQEEPIYSFKVKDISAQVSLAIFTILGGIFGALVTFIVTI